MHLYSLLLLISPVFWLMPLIQRSLMVVVKDIMEIRRIPPDTALSAIVLTTLLILIIKSMDFQALKIRKFQCYYLWIH